MIYKVMKITEYKEWKPFRILLISGSARSATSCPGEEGKTAKLIRVIKESLPKWVELDILDLKVDKDPVVLPCKGCISTAGGAHCHYPCDCYEPEQGDFLSDQDVYRRGELADAIVLITPIYWFSVPGQVKNLFDRLVCINQTITHDEAIDLLGDSIKLAKATRKLSSSEGFSDKLKNHWAGKRAGFIAHGDDGADDYANGLPKTYRPESTWTTLINLPEIAIMPLVEQMRYSGLEVQDEWILARHLNKGLSYAAANDALNGSEWKKLETDIINMILSLINK
jgi:hypothetical protein